MVHVVREGGKFIPMDYLKKVSEKGDGRTFGLAAATTDKTGVFIRQSKGGLTPEDVDVLQKHDAVKDHRIVMGFDNSVIHEDDQQPFVLLKNGEDVPQIVAFLDGDFSEYHDDGSSHTDEFFCVQKELIPRIAKLGKFLGNNPAAIMKELTEDDSYGRDWMNFMNGPSGSITLVAATGEIVIFSVAGDEKTHEFNGWWTSNKMDYEKVSSKSGGSLDDLAAAMAGKSKNTKVRHTDGGTKPATATAPTEPTVAKPGKDGGSPLDGGKPADAQPLPGGDKSVEPAPDAGQTAPQGANGKPDFSHPETVLTLLVPKRFDSFKSKYRWVKKRLPDSMIPSDNAAMQEFIQGLHTISLKRIYANKAFLQDFAQQEGMSGVNALSMVVKGSDTSVPSVPKTEEKIATPKTDTALPTAAGRTKVRQDTSSGYPAKKGETKHIAETKPIEQPKAPAPDAAPSTVTPPLPVMSESQVKQVAEFVEKPETKLAIDKAGRVIADPKNLERVEQACPSLEKQTANRITVFDAAKYPYETLIKIGIMNPNTLACIAFWLGHELQKSYVMMDELTKRPEASAGEVQAPVANHEQAARHLMPTRTKVRRSA